MTHNGVGSNSVHASTRYFLQYKTVPIATYISVQLLYNLIPIYASNV